MAQISFGNLQILENRGRFFEAFFRSDNLSCERNVLIGCMFGFIFCFGILSTKPRARESGEIVREYFPDVPHEYSELLEEGNPGPNIPTSKPWK